MTSSRTSTFPTKKREEYNELSAFAKRDQSWALGLLLVVLGDLIPVARALILVPVSPRRHTLALLAAHSAVVQAPVHHSGLGAPHLALGFAIG